MYSIAKNEIYKLFYLCPRIYFITTKWVFKKKLEFQVKKIRRNYAQQLIDVNIEKKLIIQKYLYLSLKNQPQKP